MNIKDIYLFVNTYLKDVIGVIFPTYCTACSHVLTPFEDEICTKCRHQLPFIHSREQFQLFENQLINTYSFVTRTTFSFKYQKNSSIQQLIHQFKYKKHEKLGKILGLWHLNILKNAHFTDKIDLIIPVPLHAKKLKKRGYNQLDVYAKTLAKELNAEFSSKVLIKIKDTKTQSKQNRSERFRNMQGSIIVNPESTITNTHILLVDDIVTTGATIETCLEALKAVSGLRVTIAAIAITLLD